ncbi:hypothetical protein LCGC14_2964850 [marine sediment metagenome]|uniref:Phage replisome organiser N-terminal domain-containing protein n=1 Tax=marine sediment metagenome TaxID=412755 RepID=A0A0F8XC25_9ZZZZ
MYPIDCLDGSIRYQLEPDERGVWYDLLNYSAICAQPGTIADKDGRPYPHSFIANRLNISQELLDATLKKCTDEGRIKDDNGVIVIANWGAYQSEYQRQKPYREKKDIYSEAVRLTKEEYRKLVDKFGQKGADDGIENLSLYVQSKGDKYKSHYATILSWDRRDQKEASSGKDRRNPEKSHDQRLKDSVRKK